MKKLIILAGLAVTAAANAQLVVGNDATTTTIYYIDVNTGAATPLFPVGTAANQKTWGMAADNENQIMYWNNGGNLFRCSFADMMANNPLGISAPLAMQQTSTSTTGVASINFVALAYDPVTDRLLGTRNIATEAVYEINTTTGMSLPLYVHPTTYDFGGLDCDPITGALYGLSDAPAGSRGLYSINIAGATETFLAASPNNPATGTQDTDIDGLAIGGGRAYMVTDGTNVSQPDLYVIDLATNTQVGSIPSPFAGSGTFAAAAWMAPVANQAVSGTLNLSDTVGAFAFARSIAYVVKQGGSPVANGSISCNGAATVFSLSVPASVVGAVTIELNGSSFLRRITAANLTGSNQAIGSIAMQNGDVNNSGEVDAVDIDDVIANFGFLGDDSTDVNVDGEVDAVDIDIVIANFGGLDD